MHKVAKAVLEGYREWTEELGEDREWKIQRVQARIDEVASVEAAKCGAFYAPSRRDVLIFISNNVPNECIKNVVRSVSEVSPVPVKLTIGYGKTPLDALLEPKDEGDEGAVVAAHVDINSFSQKDHYLGYVEVLDMISGISKLALGFGGVSFYLGGDNVIVFLDTNEYEKFASFVSKMYKVKVGVGIADLPREAVAKAAYSLKVLRRRRDQSIFVATKDI